MANTSILTAFERMWQHVVAKLGDKADKSHTHNDIYYTETEIDTKLSGKANSSHTHTIANVTNLQSTLDAKVPTSRTINGKALTANITLAASDVGAATSSHTHDDRYYTETEIDTKLSAKSDTTHNHDTKYDAKGAAADALASANSYTDTKTANLASTSSVDTKISTHNTSTSAHNDIRDLISGLTTRLNTLANSDDTTLDQMSEVVDYIKNNKSLIDGITTSKVDVSDIVNNLTTNVTNKPLSAAQGVAVKTLIDVLQEELDSHGHVIADVSGLQGALDGKAASEHGVHVTYSTTAPVMDGTASVGTASTVARSDHKHPTDTSRASKSEFDTHNNDTTKHITSTERTNWNTAATNVVTAQNRADSAYALAESKVDSLSDLGITTTATELNYMGGVTSNVQTQLDDIQSSLNTKVSESDITYSINSSVQTVSARYARVAFGAGKFVALPYRADANSKFLYSTNGVEWNEINAPVNAAWRDIVYGDNKFVAVSSTTTSGGYYGAYSSDGLSWTLTTLPSGGSPNALAYGNGRFIYVGSNTATAYSTDGINWTQVLVPSSSYSFYSSCIAYGNGKFIAPYASGGIYFYTTDGINWASGTFPTGSYSRIIYANGKFVAVGNNSMAYSEDGDNWTKITPPTSTNWYAIAYGSGKFIVLGFSSSNMIYSSDGMNWETTTISESNSWCDLAYGNGAFVAVTEGAYSLLTISVGNKYGLAYQSEIVDALSIKVDKQDLDWVQIYDSGSITTKVNSISNINISGYKKLMVAVACVNDGNISKSGSAIFTASNGTTYQFPCWTNMFSTTAGAVSAGLARFDIIDGYIVCPNASRHIRTSNFLSSTEGGTADNLTSTGGGIMKCTNALSTLAVSSLDQDSSCYFGVGSRVIVWGGKA